MLITELNWQNCFLRISQFFPDDIYRSHRKILLFFCNMCLLYIRHQVKVNKLVTEEVWETFPSSLLKNSCLSNCSLSGELLYVAFWWEIPLMCFVDWFYLNVIASLKGNSVLLLTSCIGWSGTGCYESELVIDYVTDRS